VFDGNNEAAVTAARARWTEYKAKGYALQYIKQQPGGSWKMEAESAAA
jgi:DNA polymerase IIIc chi subunit